MNGEIIDLILSIIVFLVNFIMLICLLYNSYKIRIMEELIEESHKEEKYD